MSVPPSARPRTANTSTASFEDALVDLFLQSLRWRRGWAWRRWDTFTPDGSKLEASASKH
ncbi:hypothetical protein ACWDBF_12885 [Streptomyces angustmyceticus]